jgi:hypothetical protein
MEIAGKLMDKGINFTRIIEETFYQKTFAQQQILAGSTLADGQQAQTHKQATSHGGQDPQSGGGGDTEGQQLVCKFCQASNDGCIRRSKQHGTQNHRQCFDGDLQATQRNGKVDGQDDVYSYHNSVDSHTADCQFGFLHKNILLFLGQSIRSGCRKYKKSRQIFVGEHFTDTANRRTNKKASFAQPSIVAT